MTNEELVEKIREALADKKHGKCPSCGRCSECGHTPWGTLPAPYYPSYPWWQPYRGFMQAPR